MTDLPDSEIIGGKWGRAIAYAFMIGYAVLVVIILLWLALGIVDRFILPLVLP